VKTSVTRTARYLDHCLPVVVLSESRQQRLNAICVGCWGKRCIGMLAVIALSSSAMLARNTWGVDIVGLAVVGQTDPAASIDAIVTAWGEREFTSATDSEVRLFQAERVVGDSALRNALRSQNHNVRRCAAVVLQTLCDSSFSEALALAIACEDVPLTKICMLHALTCRQIPPRFDMYLSLQFGCERESGVRATIAGMLVLSVGDQSKEIRKYFEDGLTPAVATTDSERTPMTIWACRKMASKAGSMLTHLRKLRDAEDVGDGIRDMARQACDEIEMATLRLNRGKAPP
jgi:hypothetical protein